MKTLTLAFLIFVFCARPVLAADRDIDGWEGLKWGTSASDVARKFHLERLQQPSGGSPLLTLPSYDFEGYDFRVSFYFRQDQLFMAWLLPNFDMTTQDARDIVAILKKRYGGHPSELVSEGRTFVNYGVQSRYTNQIYLNFVSGKSERVRDGMFVFQFRSDQVPMVRGWNKALWGMTRTQVLQAYPCAYIVEAIQASRPAPILAGQSPTLFIPSSSPVEWFGMKFDTFFYLRNNRLFAVVLRPQQVLTSETGSELANTLSQIYGQGLYGSLSNPTNPCLVYERVLSRNETPRKHDVWTFDVRFTYDTRHPEASEIWLVNPDTAGSVYEQFADPFTLTAEILPDGSRRWSTTIQTTTNQQGKK